MNINGKIDLLFDTGVGLTLRIEDDDANVTFLETVIPPEDVVRLFSRQIKVPCTLKIKSLDKVGKKHKNKKFEFPIPLELEKRENREKLYEYAKKVVPKNWVADKYYDLQDSFFMTEKEMWARVTIRKWSKK